MQTVDSESPDSAAELEADLTELVRLISTSRVPEARELVLVLAKKWPDSRHVQHMARVLEPPRVIKSGGPTRSVDKEFAWLRAHAHEYPGCWLALVEDRLIAADPEYRVVSAAIREAVGQAGALVFYQPAEEGR